ncbi:MAG: cytochrome b [Rhodobacteraceae bacterium]|nr:MAG: cytochrome b [Paracoccaceae bacterium]
MIPRYALLRRVLHWIVAVLVIGMIPGGLIFTEFDNRDAIEGLFGAGSFNRFYDLHKSVGVVVLALMAARVGAMLVWPAPARTPPLSPPVRLAATVSHAALYVLLIVTPLLGWAGVSAFRAPIPVFGFFEMPPIAPQDRELSRWLLDLHSACAFAIAALVTIHVAAAFWHRNVREDTVFYRIGFGRRRPTPGE